MYIKKAIREEIEKLDNYISDTGLPEKWDDFVNENKEYLILKSKQQYQCNCCNFIFESNKKVNDYEICPNCDRNSLIKTHSIKNYNVKKDLMLIDKNEDKVIKRRFELLCYLNENKKMVFSVKEWSRSILGKNLTTTLELINNCAKNIMGSLTIVHYEEPEKWRPYNWKLSDGCKVYQYNLNQLFPSKYYDLNTLFKHIEYPCLENIIYGVKENNYILEMLIKAKLYNLAKEYYNFKKKKNFKDVLGLDRTFLQFMQEHNITYEELEILKEFKVKNINFIRYMGKIYAHDRIEILKYCNPLDLYNYGVKDTRVYLDYLRFAEELGFDLKNKKYLYPKHLKKSHDELMNRVEIIKNEKIIKGIQKRVNKLSKYKYQNNQYLIIPAKNIDELKTEGKELNHCVATYAEDYSKGKTDIYFLRKCSRQNIPFVTVEVKNNKVIQNRTKNNNLPGKREVSFLQEWETKILKKL